MKKPYSFFLEEELISTLQEKLTETNCSKHIFEQLVLLILNESILIQNDKIAIGENNFQESIQETKEEETEERALPKKISIREILSKNTNVSSTLSVPLDWVIGKDLYIVRSMLDISDVLYPEHLKLAKKIFKSEVDGKDNAKNKEHLIDVLCDKVVFKYFL